MKQWIEYFSVPRHLACAIAAVSAATLAMAYISQYGFGLQPCMLCLYQRIPYALNIVFGICALLASFRYPRLMMLLLMLSVLSFFAGAAVAGFHVGVEQKWWQGIASCGGNVIPPHASVEDLRALLTQQRIVRCDTPAWTLLGISMAGYNFMLSLALVVITLFLVRRNAR